MKVEINDELLTALASTRCRGCGEPDFQGMIEALIYDHCDFCVEEEIGDFEITEKCMKRYLDSKYKEGD